MGFHCREQCLFPFVATTAILLFPKPTRKAVVDKEAFLQSGLIEQYVLGLTTPEESAEVERYAKAFPEIAEEIEALQQSLRMFAAEKGIPEKAAPVPQIVVRSASRFWPVVAALVLVAFGISTWLYRQERQEHRALSGAYQDLVHQCEVNRLMHQASADQLQLLKEPGTRMVLLSDAAAHRAVAYCNKAHDKVLLHLTGLPMPPEGHAYQVWADIAGEMVDMGVVPYQPDEFLSLPFLAAAHSFNITIEPSGGSEHPTVSRLVASGNLE